MQVLQTLSYCAPLVEGLRYTTLSPEASLETETLIRKVCALTLPFLQASQVLHCGVSACKGITVISTCGGIAWVLVPIFVGKFVVNMLVLIHQQSEVTTGFTAHLTSNLTDVVEIFQDMAVLYNKTTLNKRSALMPTLFYLTLFHRFPRFPLGFRPWADQFAMVVFGPLVSMAGSWLTEKIGNRSALYVYESYRIAVTVRHAPSLGSGFYRHVSPVHLFVHIAILILTKTPTNYEPLLPVTGDFITRCYYLLNAGSSFLARRGLISFPGNVSSNWVYGRLIQKEDGSLVISVRGRELEVKEDCCPISYEDWSNQQEVAFHLTPEETENSIHVFSRESFDLLSNRWNCPLCRRWYAHCASR